MDLIRLRKKNSANSIELEANTNYEINYLYIFLATIALGSLKRRFNN